MTYAADCPINSDHGLVGMVRRYLDSIIGPYNLEDYNRQCYPEALTLMTSQWGSLITDMIFTDVKVAVPRNLEAGTVVFDTHVKNLFNAQVGNIGQAAEEVRAEMDDQDKKTTVFFLHFTWYRNEGGRRRGVGHTGAIIIDLKKKTQVMYDPHGRYSVFKAMYDTEPLLEGYTNVPANEALDFTFQRHVEALAEIEEQKGYVEC